MKLLYKQILGDPRAKKIEPPVLKFIEDLLTDVNRRLGEDKSDPIYKQIDDKWLFTTHYFREHGRRHGFRDCTTYSLLSGQRDFEEKMKVLLRVGVNRQLDALPDWVWQIVRTHDECLSASGHLDCIYEGGVLLQK
jgi:hypothetical protein